MRCANCGFDNRAEARFCENCGSPLARSCPNCGRPVSAAAKFCGNCGYNLASVRAAASPSLADLRQTAPHSLQEKVRAAAPGAEGERKLVTVLFADIVGSTELAEALDPEDWREMVSGAHQRVSDAVHRFEGHVAQLLGDGVLVFFGAPLTHEDDPERAVRAALAVLAGIREYAVQVRGRGLPREFQVRVGVNTGTVVVGNVGSDLHLEYLAIGDTVNLAARVQSAAEPDSVLITENTRHLLGDLFELADKGRIALKGKAEPVQVYQVLGERRGAVRVRGIAGLRSPMVGRGRELATLLQVSADLQQGRGAIVSVLGEAGLGKSRLVAEWRRALLAPSAGDGTSAVPGVNWVEGRCLSYGAAMPYHLVADLLRGVLGLPADAAAEELGAALERRCDDLMGARRDEAYPFLGHLLGVPLAETSAAQVKYLDGPALQHRYAAAFRAFLAALAASGPTIVVAEDVHWADPSSVDLLSQLVSLAATAAVAFALVSRPDRDAVGWRLLNAAREVTGVSSIELHLAPLTDHDSWQLVENLLRVASLPDEARQTILAKAEGNPFFVEEVIRMLIDHGGLERHGDRWVATRDLKDIQIPDTLQGVIMARIDRLPEEVKRTLQVASVIGRRFRARVLEMVLAGAAND